MLKGGSGGMLLVAALLFGPAMLLQLKERWNKPTPQINHANLVSEKQQLETGLKDNVLRVRYCEG